MVPCRCRTLAVGWVALRNPPFQGTVRIVVGCKGNPPYEGLSAQAQAAGDDPAQDFPGAALDG
jgi:hypothetical protein